MGGQSTHLLPIASRTQVESDSYNNKLRHCDPEILEISIRDLLVLSEKECSLSAGVAKFKPGAAGDHLEWPLT